MHWVIVRACSALIKPPRHGTRQPKAASPAFTGLDWTGCFSSLAFPTRMASTPGSQGGAQGDRITQHNALTPISWLLGLETKPALG